MFEPSKTRMKDITEQDLSVESTHKNYEKFNTAVVQIEFTQALLNLQKYLVVFRSSLPYVVPNDRSFAEKFYNEWIDIACANLKKLKV